MPSKLTACVILPQWLCFTAEYVHVVTGVQINIVSGFPKKDVALGFPVQFLLLCRDEDVIALSFKYSLEAKHGSFRPHGGFSLDLNSYFMMQSNEKSK